MTTPILTAPAPAEPLNSQESLSGLAIVPSSVDHANDNEAIKKLADAVACGDRDLVFDLVRRLVTAERPDTRQTNRAEDK